MAIPLILAMTGSEISLCDAIPPQIAWMACHFSSYGTGLSNLPLHIPPGSMVIVNDRTPVCGHDPEQILFQLCELVKNDLCSSILLDFQRPDEAETKVITQAIVENPPCPVGVADSYAADHSCPVFLPPVPPHIPLEVYLSPWGDREIWLEVALSTALFTVTKDGCAITPPGDSDPFATVHRDHNLLCHYCIDAKDEEIRFHLHRTQEDLSDLLVAAEKFNVTRAIGLFQEIG